MSPGDREQIRDLSHRYAYHVDRRELEQVCRLFTVDGTLVLPDPPTHLEPVREFQGRQSIAVRMQSLLDIPVTLHAVLGVVIEDDGDRRAVGSVTGEAHHLTEDDAGQITDWVWYLHYFDTYERIDGDWRIAERRLHIDWIETRPVRRRRREWTP
jgi:hypothetical protein